MALLARTVLFTLLALTLVRPAFAENNLKLFEQEIKAGLLYNFLKYTNWPASAPSMNVCILGDDPFGEYLTPMAKRTVKQRPITISKIKESEAVDQCHLLFVNVGEQNWGTWQKVLTGKPILTVSDFSGFAASGGMIEFGHEDNRINATLNIDAVSASGLQVEDRLLKLVTVVHSSVQEPQP